MPEDGHSFRLPKSRHALPLALALGVGTSLLLFVLIAVIQKITTEHEPTTADRRDVVYVTPPEDIRIEEPPEETEADEPEPELEKEPPRIDLSSLDLALNPGTGGDFMVPAAIPSLEADAAALNAEDFVNFADLDEAPRLRGGSRFNFSERIRQRFEGTSGAVLLYIRIERSGDVLAIEARSTNLPEAVVQELIEIIQDKGFTVPKVRGQPTRAEATLPINLTIQ